MDNKKNTLLRSDEELESRNSLSQYVRGICGLNRDNNIEPNRYVRSGRVSGLRLREEENEKEIIPLTNSNSGVVKKESPLDESDESFINSILSKSKKEKEKNYTSTLEGNRKVVIEDYDADALGLLGDNAPTIVKKRPYFCTTTAGNVFSDYKCYVCMELPPFFNAHRCNTCDKFICTKCMIASTISERDGFDKGRIPFGKMTKDEIDMIPHCGTCRSFGIEGLRQVRVDEFKRMIVDEFYSNYYLMETDGMEVYDYINSNTFFYNVAAELIHSLALSSTDFECEKKNKIYLTHQKLYKYGLHIQSGIGYVSVKKRRDNSTFIITFYSIRDIPLITFSSTMRKKYAWNNMPNQVRMGMSITAFKIISLLHRKAFLETLDYDGNDLEPGTLPYKENENEFSDDLFEHYKKTRYGTMGTDHRWHDVNKNSLFINSHIFDMNMNVQSFMLEEALIDVGLKNRFFNNWFYY